MKETGAQEKNTGAAVPGRLRRAARALVFAALAGALATCWADPMGLRQAFMEQVDRRLDPPPDEVQRYGNLARDELRRAGIAEEPPQYALLVDRSASVQALFAFWLPAGAAPVLIGAAPVSTGRRGGFEYFETPLGVYRISGSRVMLPEIVMELVSVAMCAPYARSATGPATCGGP